MASRAHAIHDYPFVRPSERPRRQVFYQNSEDPIELPLNKSGRAALFISALLASAVIAGGAYAIHYGPAPALAETPSSPLTPSWKLDDQPAQAGVARLLRGKAQAPPPVDAPVLGDEQATETSFEGPASLREQEVFIISKESAQPEPAPVAPRRATPDAPPQAAPYPNPTTTPPEGIGPHLELNKPTPGLDPENPY